VQIHSVVNWLRLFAVSFLFVVLIIIIFLMLVLPLRPDVPAFVHVPTARWASKSAELAPDLTISIRANGTTYLGDADVQVTALAARLFAARRQRTDTPIVRIRGDRAATFHTVRRAVSAARDAGFKRVTFMVRQETVTLHEGFSLIPTAPENPNPRPAP